MILLSLLFIAKTWVCYWSLIVIYNCECSLSCILYKANVWTFDSCYNSVSGLWKKEDLLKLCGWCCAFSSFHTIFGKMTGNKYQSKCESTKYSPHCLMLWPAWMGIALLRCSADFWYSDWLWHQDNLIFCCFSTNFRPETLQFDGLSANVVFNLYIKDSQTLKESNHNHISWESCYIIELLEMVSESKMIKL